MKKSVYLALIAKASAEDPPATAARVSCRYEWRGITTDSQDVVVSDYEYQTCYDAGKLVIEADYSEKDVCLQSWNTDDEQSCILYYPEADARWGDSRRSVDHYYNEEYDYELSPEFADQDAFDTFANSIHAWSWSDGTQYLTPIDEYTGTEPDVMQPGTTCTMPENPGFDDLVVLEPVAFETPEACYGEALWYIENTLEADADICVLSITEEEAYLCVGVKVADQGDIREDAGAAMLDEVVTPDTIVDEITYEEFQDFKSELDKLYAWVWVDGALVETALESSWDYDDIEAQLLALEEGDDDGNDEGDDKGEDAASWIPAGVATIAATMTFMF